MKHKINSITLKNYRNHEYFNQDIHSNAVILVGDNGAGKTNILEAISLLTPGKGIRSSSNDEIDMITPEGVHKNWSANFNLEGNLGNSIISMEHTGSKRICKLNDQLVKNQAELAVIVNLIWVTPIMDQIFISASSNRRKFIDRMVYNFDHNHATNVIKYDKLIKERMKILKSRTQDNVWIKTIEQKIAEYGFEIAKARVDLTHKLNEFLDIKDANFPKASIKMSGVIEDKINLLDRNEIISIFKQMLEKNRSYDLKSMRTNAGIHRSDLLVYHLGKNMPAGLCSTGEQKSLLVSIILAKAKAFVKEKSVVPILLLDELAAHLDEGKRLALMNELKTLGAQFWVTTTDRELFLLISDIAQFIEL